MSRAKDWGSVLAAPLPKALDDAIDQAKRASATPREPKGRTVNLSVEIPPRMLRKLKIAAIDRSIPLRALIEELLREAGYGD